MHPILQILRDPETVLALDHADWNRVLASARRERLAARLSWVLEDAGLLERIPAQVRTQLLAARVRIEHLQRLMRAILLALAGNLKNSDIQIALLKGCAYAMADLPPARGRFMADVDILVKKDDMAELERVLLRQGWSGKELNEYDQNYYREWMHELPPLTHPALQMELDVHHNLAPPVSRIKLNAQQLWDEAKPIPGTPWFRLSDTDLVLHTAVHLFFNEELRGGLRELLDIHDVCGHFGADIAWWHTLLERARRLGMQAPLYHALTLSERLLGTPLPADVRATVQTWAPNPLARGMLHHLFEQALQPSDPEVRPNPRFAGLIDTLLLARSHWLRMPLTLLIPHLARKALRRDERSTLPG